MRAKELCTLDNLPDDVLQGLGERAHALRRIGTRSEPDASQQQEPSP